jgi:AcrR family transcriptional regulator
LSESTTAPRRLTRKERQAETRRRLLDAAETVFLRRGFDRASVEEITAEAGFTRGAFYSNFESKEQLFFELLADRAYAEYTRILDRTPQDMTPREQLRWGAETLVDRYSRAERTDGHWLARLWLECISLAAREERFRKLAEGFWKGNRETIAERFRNEYERRGIEPPIEPRHLASGIIALDIGLFLQHLVDPEAVPLEIYPPLYDVVFGDLVEPRAKDGDG